MKLIDKSALVAEIERIKKEECPIDTYEGRSKLFYFEQFLSFINTLEVEEVDLEKEIDKFYGMYRKDRQTFLLEDNEECVDWKEICNPEFEIYFAKYFFELGLKAQKGE